MSLGDYLCELNTQTGEVLLNGKVILLRPKTFELLLFLASSPNAIHSKGQILASVWQGLVVEDQVIFQSINEIRKELGIAEAIKTYPRRGYKWDIPVSIVDSHSASPTVNQGIDVTHRSWRWLLLGLALLVVVMLTVFYLNTKQPGPSTQHQDAPHKGILVLPFEVSALDESQKWLRYGAMEGLIKRISPNNDITVFHLEDTIEILNRIALDERNDISEIFAKSGAFYILKTSLSGQPGELNVVYTIYTRTSRITETIQATNHEELLSSLVQLFEQASGDVFNSTITTFDHQLQNDLIAKAMQFLEVDDLTSALSFVESAVLNDPDNIMAAFLQVKINMELGRFTEGMVAVDKALAITDQSSLTEYQHRLWYFKGAGLAASGKLVEARDTLQASQQLSQRNKDWLYYAYNKSMLGQIELAQQNYQAAYPLLQSALDYQQLLNCPVGIATGYLDFADYYLRSGDNALAEQNFQLAKALVEEKNLKQVQPLLSRVAQQLY